MGHCNVNFQKNGDCDPFKNNLALNGLSQMNNSPTRLLKESSTIIDIIASNKDSNIKVAVTIPTSLSDHFI